MSTGLPRLSECRECHDPIRFVRMNLTGRAMPVNPKPSPDHGTIAARLTGGALVGFVISKDHRPSPADSFRFVPHYATCEAQQKPKSKTPAPAADTPLF